MIKSRGLAVCLLCFTFLCCRVMAREEYAPKNITYKALTPAASIKTMEIPEGFKIQVVASEPMVQEPVSFAFDADGALYVCEWLTYMQDEHGKNQLAPLSRVVKLVDTNGDGKMDKRTVFIDKVILPRNVLPLEDKVLVILTGSNSVYSYFDDNHDGVSDRREVAYQGKKNNGNIEHQSSGLIWNLDNIIYNNYNRFKYDNGKLIAENHSVERISQWGLARDDDGRIYCSWAGGGNPAHSFHLPGGYPIVSYKKNDYYGPDYATPNSICKVEDQSSGKYDHKNDRILVHFSATCGQTVLRSPLFPEYYGHVATPEPVGRLIRLTRIEWINGKGFLHNACPDTEFIRSSDPFFRPVWSEVGPDGCFYFSDMYRGIIQEKRWFPTEGKHPWVKRYQRVKEWGMLKVFRHGRIYRLVPENKKISNVIQLSKLSTQKLVKHLESDNGWVRDTTQKLLVLRNNKGISKSLEEIAFRSKNTPGRLAALWTMQGLGLLEKKHLLKILNDANTQVRRTAVQLSESHLGQDADIDRKIKSMTSEQDPFVATQLYLAMSSVKDDSFKAIKNSLTRQNSHLPVLKTYINMQNKNAKALHNKLLPGEKIYQSMCNTCHGNQGNGIKEGDKFLAPPLADNRWFKNGGDIDTITKILLKGLNGPINGVDYGEGMMIPLEKMYNDKQLADVINYIGFSWNGWKNSVAPKRIKDLRRKYKKHNKQWENKELIKKKTALH